MDSRTKNTQLASGEALGGMLATEAKRPIPAGKESVNYVDISLMLEWLQYFNLPCDLLAGNTTGTKAGQIILDQAPLLIDQLTTSMLQAEFGIKDLALFDRVYTYLATEDAPKPADLLFVFGAKTPLRMQKAIELYQQGLAPKLMISGRSPFYASGNSQTEAEQHKAMAVEAGIPAEAIITEDQSTTIPDNVRSSLNMLDSLHIQADRIILINSPYAQRRGWAHFMKYTPDTTKLFRVNSGTGDKYRRDTWFTNEDGVRTVANEYIKLYVAAVLNTA